MTEPTEELAQLFDTGSLQRKIISLAPDLIAAQFGPRSRLPHGVVCLLDADVMLWEAQYALSQAIDHFRSDSGAPTRGRDASLLLVNYYAMDVALRLYAAAEHVANAITVFMSLDEAKVRAFAKAQREEKGFVSDQAVIGSLLRAEHKGHPVATTLGDLLRNADWKRAIRYRNEWVHDQGPLLQVMGVVWRRGNRWKSVKGVHQSGIGGGDKRKIDTDELLFVMKGALAAFTTAMDAIVDWVYVRLGELKAAQRANRSRSTGAGGRTA